MATSSVRRIVFVVATLVLSVSASAQNRAIDELLKTAVEHKRVPGVVAMVARGDAVVYQGAFGKQYEARGLPMAPDTIFRVASMTKPITSVAVMQLVERGKVKLDEPAATYLPELKGVQVLEGFAMADLRESKEIRHRAKKLSEAQLRRERLQQAKKEFLRSNPQTRQ